MKYEYSIDTGIRSYFLIVFIAIAVFSIMLYSYFASERMISKYTPLIDASMEIKLEMTTAHLKFEEILAGDPSEKIKEVFFHIGQSVWYARAMLEGGQNEEGTFLPLSDPELRREIEAVIDKLREFANMTRQRNEVYAMSAVGSEIDQSYDALFQSLISQADHVESLLQNEIKAEFQFYKMVEKLLIFITLVLSGFVFLMQLRYDRNRKMMQAQTIRTAQMASVGELSSRVAHEINNPISGVINCAQILLNRSDENDRDKDLLQRIIKEGNRVADIVKGLLHFARDDSDIWCEHYVPDSINEALSLVDLQLQNDGIFVNVQTAEDLPLVNCNPQQMVQLFLNLINNARYALNEKYPGDHEGKCLDIMVDTTQENDDRFIRVTLRDHGTGIPGDILPRVMTPFVTTKLSDSGTGLGLSICSEIAKKHGGTIKIDSEFGQYTNVTTTFRAADPESV